MKNILITAATELEISSLRELEFDNHDINYFVTGIGEKARDNIARKISIIGEKTDVVINLGLCGSLSQNIKKRTLLVPRKVNFENETKPPIELKNINIRKVNQSISYRAAPLLTVLEPVNGRDRKMNLLKTYPEAAGVDMELYYWAEELKSKDIKLVAIKIISDYCENIDLTKLKQETQQLIQPIKNIIKMVIDII